MGKSDKAGHGSGGKPQARKAAKAAAREQQANEATARQLRRAGFIRKASGNGQVK